MTQVARSRRCSLRHGPTVARVSASVSSAKRGRPARVVSSADDCRSPEPFHGRPPVGPATVSETRAEQRRTAAALGRKANGGDPPGRRRTRNAAGHPSRQITKPARTRSASPPGRHWPNVGLTQQTKPSCDVKVTAVDLLHSTGGAGLSHAWPSCVRAPVCALAAKTVPQLPGRVANQLASVGRQAFHGIRF